MGHISLTYYFTPSPKHHLGVTGNLSGKTSVNSWLCKLTELNTYLFTWEWTDFANWPTLSIPKRQLLISQDINLEYWSIAYKVELKQLSLKSKHPQTVSKTVESQTGNLKVFFKTKSKQKELDSKTGFFFIIFELANSLSF